MTFSGCAVNSRILESRRLLTVILVAAFVWSLFQVSWRNGLVHPGGGDAIAAMAAGLLHPSVSTEILLSGLRESWRTVAYAVTGITVAIAIGFPLGIVASGVLSRSIWKRRVASSTVRFCLAFFRSIHELVWAWMFVAAFGLSPMAAVLALGIPYGGILGRIYSELLQDVSQAPLRALRSAGASEWRILWHGRLPMALPDIVSYTFYRLECGVRAAAVMSFIGLGGLGQRIQLALDDLAFPAVSTYLLFLIGLVAIVDLWSSLTRRSLAS